MNLKIANIAKYARGTAPFAGIPIAGVGTIVFLRRHLQAALEIQPNRIIYNADTKVITFRNHRAEWKLNDLLGQGKLQRWQIRDQLTAWAHGKRSGARKRKATKALGKEGVYVRRLREAVAKLTKQRDNIYLHRPVHPLLPREYTRGDYGRDQMRAWVEEKVVRKAIAKVVGQKLMHGEPKTWADFYRELEKVSGRHVSESQTYARVHARKRYRHGLSDYPDREDYLKNLPRYLVMAEKPWDRRPWDPFKKDTYGEQLNAVESHAKARREYVAFLRERQAIESQIEAHQTEIKSMTEAA